MIVANNGDIVSFLFLCRERGFGQHRPAPLLEQLYCLFLKMALNRPVFIKFPCSATRATSARWPTWITGGTTHMPWPSIYLLMLLFLFCFYLFVFFSNFIKVPYPLWLYFRVYLHVHLLPFIAKSLNKSLLLFWKNFNLRQFKAATVVYFDYFKLPTWHYAIPACARCMHVLV
jgi:hypothetical protein